MSKVSTITLLCIGFLPIFWVSASLRAKHLWWAVPVVVGILIARFFEQLLPLFQLLYSSPLVGVAAIAPLALPFAMGVIFGQGVRLSVARVPVRIALVVILSAVVIAVAAALESGAVHI